MKKLLILLLAMFSLAGCGTQVARDDGRVNVVATVGMVGDMVENIGGDFVSVKSLMGPGVDPHLYQPSAGDIAKLENADVVFYVGLHLEGKMVEIFESLAEKKPVFALSDVLDEKLLLDPQVGQTGNYDPHIWFDVGLWSGTVVAVRDALSEFDPENAETYKVNAEAYLKKLTELDAWVQKGIDLIPENQRLMITAHDAFNYFGEAYGMDVRGIQGISTAADFGLKDLEKLIDLIVEREVPAIFVESSVSKKSIEALQEGVIARGWNVEIGGVLFSDAMGDFGTEEGTYLGMVRHNVNVIVNSLK